MSIGDYKKKLKDEGKCIRCGKPREQWARYCNLCREKVNDHQREWARQNRKTKRSLEPE